MLTCFTSKKSKNYQFEYICILKTPGVQRRVCKSVLQIRCCFCRSFLINIIVLIRPGSTSEHSVNRDTSLSRFFSTLKRFNNYKGALLHFLWVIISSCRNYWRLKRFHHHFTLLSRNACMFSRTYQGGVGRTIPCFSDCSMSASQYNPVTRWDVKNGLFHVFSLKTGNQAKIHSHTASLWRTSVLLAFVNTDFRTKLDYPIHFLMSFCVVFSQIFRLDIRFVEKSFFCSLNSNLHKHQIKLNSE